MMKINNIVHVLAKDKYQENVVIQNHYYIMKIKAACVYCTYCSLYLIIFFLGWIQFLKLNIP